MTVDERLGRREFLRSVGALGFVTAIAIGLREFGRRGEALPSINDYKVEMKALEPDGDSLPPSQWGVQITGDETPQNENSVTFSIQTIEATEEQDNLRPFCLSGGLAIPLGTAVDRPDGVSEAKHLLVIYEKKSGFLMAYGVVMKFKRQADGTPTNWSDEKVLLKKFPISGQMPVRMSWNGPNINEGRIDYNIDPNLDCVGQ